MAELKGTIRDVIFRNAENGYTVLELDTRYGVKTVVGVIPPVSDGQQLLVQGEYRHNSRFGEQFAAAFVKVSPPSTQANLAKFLASGIFHGVGKVTAEAIVRTFGENTLEIIEYSPDKLAYVKGISIRKAREISENYRDNREMQDFILFLANYDVSINLALKIYKHYERQAYAILNRNPYQMVEDIDGVGFITADRIALNMKLNKDSSFRIKAGICYVLKDSSSSNGNTYLPEKELYEEAYKLLGGGEDMAERIKQVVAEMSEFNDVKLINTGEHTAVMLERNFLLEKKIATRLLNLLSEAVPVCDDEKTIEKEIEVYTQKNNMVLHPMQKEAVIAALTKGCVVITGGPGTGKTTIIKVIISVMRRLGVEFSLCAPTGRAAKRMNLATGEEAKTIHRLLDLNYKGEGYEAAFTYNEDTRLESEVIIADEISMCDEYVFNALIQAVKTGGKLILVGDADQLASVGAGNVLKDIISSGKVDVIRLTQIYRQDENSFIVTNAHRINHGQMPLINNNSKDFFFIQKDDPTDILNEITDLCMTRLPNFKGVDPMSIQVLVPLKKGIAGVINLNVELQKMLNPPETGKYELKCGENIFRVGDKVIHTKNNYQLEWKRVNKVGENLVEEEGVGVFNGDIGYVSSVDKAKMNVTVTFEDGRVAFYTPDILDQLSLAYAISIHKSQGSEFDVIVIGIMGGGNMILTRNLLYTAITRAKSMVVIVSNRETLEKMVANNYMKKRYTLLADMLSNKNGILENA